MAVNSLGGELVQPLGLVGGGPQSVPSIETRSEEQFFQDVTTPTGLKPIQPGVATPLPADPFAEFADAGFDSFADAPDEFAAFQTADDLDVRSVDELSADREKFNPVDYFSQNPDVSESPEKLSKLLAVYRKRREEGLDAGEVIKSAIKETPGLVADIAGGVKRLGERAIDVVVQPVANVVLGTLTGDMFDDKKRAALFSETRKVIKKGVAEVGAGSEAATVGLVDLSRTGLRKLDPASLQPGNRLPPGRFNPPTGHAQTLKPKTDQELLSDISDDVAFRANAEEILTGQGEAAKNFGLDKETLAKQGIEIDEKAIAQLSLVDPVTLVSTGGAFKIVGVGGKILGTAKTLAGAEKLTEGLSKIARIGTGRTIQGAGKLTTLAGKELRGTGTSLATVAGVSTAISGGGLPASVATGALVKGTGKAARFFGPKIESLGKGIAEGSGSAGVQKVMGLARAGTATAATVGEGAVKGIAAASPFAVAADEDATAGALFGAGAALGAGAAAGAGAFRVVKNATSRRYFGPNRPVLPDVASPAYGFDSALDAQHETNISKLSVQDASELKNFREALRQQGGEIYAVDQPTFRQKVAEEYRARTGQEIDPTLLTTYENHSAFFDTTSGDRKVVYLNSDTKGLQHDAGHIFDAVLPEEKRAELRAAVEQAFTPEQRQAFRDTYERRVGSKISDTAAVDEFIAEQFSSLFNNVPVTELNAPKGLLSKFIDVAAEGAEALGIDLAAGATTPNLGAPVSVGIRQLFRNAAGEVTRANIEGIPAQNITPLPATPPPAPPGTAPVAPPTNVVPLTGRPIRPSGTDLPAPTTPEARAAAARRFSETGIEQARLNAASDPVIAKAVNDVSVHMESGNPVLEVDHLGIVSEGTPDSPEGRTSRRATQAAGYEALKGELSRAGAPDDLVARHLKTFVPVRWTQQGGTPTLIAMSLDKVLQNIQKLGSEPKAASLIPYPTENGKLTPQGWRDAVADLKAYSENQANGRRGDGGRLTVPEAGELSIPVENPGYTPQPLTPEKANFANVAQGLETPATRRAEKGKIPGNVKGQLLAEANQRAVELPVNIPAKQAGKQAFVEFPPRVVQEVNPLRNRLKEAGVSTKELIEVTERIRAIDIERVTPRPDISFKAPVTDIIRGGFLPAPTEFRQKNLGGRTVEEFSDYILKASPDEWKAATDNMTGGLTGGAWNLGLGLKDAADVGVLKSYADKFSDSAKAAMNAGEFDSAMSQVSRGQFFREAYEAATGTGSAGAAFKRGAAGMESAKPPFPLAETTTGTTSAAGPGTTTEAAKFLPVRENVAKLQAEKKLSSKAWESLLFSLNDLFSEGGYLYQLEEATLIPLFEAFGVKVEPDLQRVIDSQKLSAEERATHGIRSFSQVFEQAKQQLTDIFVNKKSLASGNIVSFPVSEATKRRLIEETPSGIQQSDIFRGPEPEEIPITGQEKINQDWDNILSLLGVSPEPPSTLPFPTPPLRDIRRAKAAFQNLVGTKEVTPPETLKPRFLPAEELVAPEQTPELRVVPAASVTPPVQPPGRGLIPPPVAAKEDKESAKFLPEPSKEIQEIAKTYAENAGITYAPTTGYAEIKPDLSKRLAKFYNDAKSDPTNPEVAASYDALIRETEEQGKAILAAGYKIEPWAGPGEPYKDSASAISDVRDNKHLYFRKTSESFGTGTEAAGNPMLAESNLVPGQSVNDVFRWVHDFFGHSKEGFQFGPRGEFNAWRAHSEMYSPDAQGALASETLAQNSWVNFGPQLEGRDIPLKDRPFAEQKNLVVPPELIAEAARFQPRTEAGRKLEEKGFEIVATGEMGSRRVTILDDQKEPIARIQSVQLSPKKAEIAFVTKTKGAPAGLGEILYREVGSRLRDDGVTSLEGQVISPEPLAIRKKIFGGFEKLTTKGRPVTYEQALATTEQPKRGTRYIPGIETVNKITEATKFLPEDQQDMNFIRQGDAAIKVRDIERERNRLISELKVVQDKDRDALVERLAQVSREAEGAWRDFTRSRAGFLPGKRDAQGRPLNTEGEIDYAKWQKEGIAARKKQRAESDKTPAIKEVGPLVEETEPTKSTGWILPDKTFVPLDTNFHEQYLTENAGALNKKFGTDFTPEESSIDDRLTALNSGFVRLRNYNGRLSVEANSTKWPSLKTKVLETLQDREGQIDSLTISLLNDSGQQVDSTSAARLFELPVPEKLNAIEEAVNTVRSGGPRFQPAEGGLPGIGVPTVEEAGRARAARRISTVKKNNPEAVTPQYARDESGEIIVTSDGSPKPLTLDYNFIESPLAKEAAKGLKGVKREEAAAVALGKKLVDFYKEVEKNPDIKAGSKWYSTARTRLRGVFGDDSKFFAELLGATSARTPVETNYRFALDAYNQFKAGAYDKTLAKYREGKAAWEAQDLGDFKGETRGQFMDFWVRKHDLGVTQSSGKKFGMNSRAVLRVLDGSWASEVVGPKTPNFAGNLTGQSFRATIDVWAGRTLHRLANDGLKDRWRILPENEVGINDSDFYLGQAAYESAAKKLGIKADALQAVLWFGEKEKWEKNGWTRGAGALKSDFNVLLSETERAPSGELRMKTPQIALDFSAEVSDLKKKR